MTYKLFQTGSLLRAKGYTIWIGHWDNRCKPGLFQENQDIWSLPANNILFSRLSHSSLNVSRYFFFPLEYSDLYSQSLSCLGSCFLLLLEWKNSFYFLRSPGTVLIYSVWRWVQYSWCASFFRKSCFVCFWSSIRLFLRILIIAPLLSWWTIRSS